jgi:hypothetical protein
VSDFENTVRPFQSGDVSPPRRYISGAAADVPNVLLQVGRTGVGRTFNGSYSLRATYYMTRYENEKSSA